MRNKKQKATDQRWFLFLRYMRRWMLLYHSPGGTDRTPTSYNQMLKAGTAVLEDANLSQADYRNEAYLGTVLRQYNAANGREPWEVVRDANGIPYVGTPLRLRNSAS